MSQLVFGFQDLDKTLLPLAGGKGANLGELSRIEGIQVPDGFCITTEAYKMISGANPLLSRLLDHLSFLQPADRREISELSAEIRGLLEEIPVPQALQEAVTAFLSAYPEKQAFAIRSSATAEDLPGASFAGQQDTYLNIIGKESVIRHVSKCWASLFTDRAIMYRMQSGFDHRKVQLAVVVQEMVFPQAAGILFTADPVSGNRKVVSVDAAFGLGEALVSGRVNADNYTVRNGQVIHKNIPAKKLGVFALHEGGTEEEVIEPGRQTQQAITDEQIIALEQTGRKIEAHFGNPQDIEWCLADGLIYIVQSRPITTLFPVPEVNDGENHVYVSVGHQQMMTDPMKPLGLSFFLLTTMAPMRQAGGRLFVDITQNLSGPDSRKAVIETLGKSDPLLRDALQTIVERGDFIRMQDEKERAASASKLAGRSVWSLQTPVENDPAIVAGLISNTETSLEELRQTIRMQSGVDLFDFILEDLQRLKSDLFDARSLGVIITGMNASAWINEHMYELLGEKNAADMLTQSVANNITSEMGLALLDVADRIRPYPEVIRYMQREKVDLFSAELQELPGGEETRAALTAYLHKYGMRCVGEIDITRTRWSENPAALVPLILSNIKNFEPGAASRKFEKGLQEAMDRQKELLDRLRKLPDGEQKAVETKEKISVVRNFSGYREYPKYGKVSRYFVYKQSLLKEIALLVDAGVVKDKEDLYYLTFPELREAVRTYQVDPELIRTRKEEFIRFGRLTPPRVLTSDGENVSGTYDLANVPENALPGLPVSSGVIEGRARVILNMEEAALQEGDILVTSFTDPSWTPLFVSVKGLVTEVGGLMTHGAVIAREYGLPAVVGVENATRLIADGQRIRVHGTEGWVEVL